MDTRLIASTIAAIGFVGASAGADVLEFVVNLDGFQEVSPVDTPAGGDGTATLDTDTNLLSWDITYADLTGDATAAHFHGPGAICEVAVVEETILDEPAPPSGQLIGSTTITDDQEADLVAGLWYVNIHTLMHAPGEIRGQVVPAALADPLPPIPSGVLLPAPSGVVAIRLVEVATGLTAPNWGASAPGDDRMFVTDQNGILWAIDVKTGDKTVFLDVTDRIVELGIFGPNTFDERGLLGVAFHPDYQANGLLYTYTSEPVDGPADFSTMPEGFDPNHQTVITEWNVPTPSLGGSVVDPDSARVLLRIDQPQFNHDGGALSFGHDGKLYISLGDGGAADDQESGLDPFEIANIGHGCHGNGTDLTNILGTVVRIDPLGNDAANGQYGIPLDNPFLSNGDAVDEIFAFGFRNPFRFSFDRQTGELYLADVGQNDIEEIDIVVSGGDYGWNHKEGSFFFVPNGADTGYVTDVPQPAPDGVIDPIAEYDHDEGIAIIGGFVYRGEEIPALAGRYVFGEFAQTFSADGRLFHLGATNNVLEFKLVGQDNVGLAVLGFGEDPNGEVYVLANDTGVPFGEGGVVLRIETKPGDMTANGIVDVRDLMRLLAVFGQTNAAADINDDGIVNVVDLLIMFGNWG